MINVSNLTFSWDENPLFENASFIVGKGQKVGLVGPNGSGKTTLLNLILKKEFPKEGDINVLGTIGFVPQEVKNDEDLENSQSIREYMDFEGTRHDFELKKVLSNLELTGLSLESQPSSLSGGQKTKLALAKVLIKEPDVLLLDEPTNFMDIAGKKWVMNFLSSYPKTLILISHDLKLMDQAIDKLLVINPQSKKIDIYKGNYSKAMKLKEQSEELLRRKVVAEKKHIKNMEEGLKKLYRYKSKKGVRARVMLERRIERLKETLPDLPLEIRKIKVKLPEPANVGELPIRAINISKSFGDLKVLENVSLSVKRGERIVLIGPNGAGKSTLIKILTGRLLQDSGEVTNSPSLKFGYYSQEFETFDLRETVMQTFIDNCKKAEGFARPFLGRYMFMGNKVFQRLETLSGGEKTRLAIACLTGNDYNLLILDEPTTYLDVISQRVILEAMKEYKGAMILVSHTEEFVKELEPDRALLLPENRIVFWSDDLLDKVGEIYRREGY